jgi:hypothetical protein
MSTKLKELTAEDISRFLDNAVARRGADYNYRDHHVMCRYVIDGQPACIVGDILINDVGLDPQILETDELNSSSSDLVLDVLTEQGLIDIKDDALTMLSVAQDMQDRHEPWGAAVEEAKQVRAEGMRLILS